jgi:hypothetical protein
MIEQAPNNQDQTNGSIQAEGLDPKWLQLAAEAHSASTSYFDSSIRKAVIDDLRQFQSLHPSGSKYLSEAYRSRSRFFRPKTRAAVRKNEAIAAEAYFSTNDVVSIKAMDEDDAIQRASAEVNSALLQYRLTKTIPWFMVLCGAYQDAQVQGLVCSYQHWQYDKRRKVDRPWVDLRPLENIRFDPAANWADPVNTSPYFIDMIPMYVKDVRSRMLYDDPKTGRPRWFEASDEEIMKATVGYTDPVRLQREQGRQDPTQARSAITSFSVVWVHRNIIEVDGVDMVFHTLGTVMVLDNPRPIDQVWFHGKRPYVIGFSVIETHKTYPPGNVRLGSQVQAELNENANQRLDNVKFSMNKRYFVRRNGQVDLRSLQRNVPSSTTMMGDIEKDVKVIDTPDVTASAYNEQDRLALDFDDLMGSFSQSSVQSNRKLNETVGGMNILTKDASQVTGYQLRVFSETWVEPVLRQLVLLEQHYETDSVILSLAGKKADVYQQFGVDEITDTLLMQELTLNVNVGTGATNPHDQLQNFINGLTALRDMLQDGILQSNGIDVREVQKEIFGKLGYKDGVRFFPEADKQDPRVAQLMKEIEQLKSELDRKQPQVIVEATARKLDAETKKIAAETVKHGVESVFSSIQTAEVIAAVPQVSPIADEVMRMAGYQNPNPTGVDPNLPQPAGAPAPGVTFDPLKNKRTGAVVQPLGPVAEAPGANSGGAEPIVGTSTSPMTPKPTAKPASPNAGAGRGIETKRADSGPIKTRAMQQQEAAASADDEKMVKKESLRAAAQAIQDEMAAAREDKRAEMTTKAMHDMLQAVADKFDLSLREVAKMAQPQKRKGANITVDEEGRNARIEPDE